VHIINWAFCYLCLPLYIFIFLYLSWSFFIFFYLFLSFIILIFGLFELIFLHLHHIPGLSTDGVSIYRSSNYSLHPVILVFLNLPPKVRFQVHHLFMSTLHSGPNDPANMNIIFKLLVKEFRLLYAGMIHEFYLES